MLLTRSLSRSGPPISLFLRSIPVPPLPRGSFSERRRHLTTSRDCCQETPARFWYMPKPIRAFCAILIGRRGVVGRCWYVDPERASPVMKRNGLTSDGSCTLTAESVMPQSPRQRAPGDRRRDPGARNKSSSRRPKPSQRERLVEAMIVLCAELGYERVSIAQINSRAGVSSATFYEQFSGKEDCMIEAYRDRKSTRLNSSHGYISYAVFCLKK